MKATLANDNTAPADLFPESTAPLCKRCELGELQPKRIETAFWRDGGLVVIRNIPAMVCPTCGEEYVADQTALCIDRMRGDGFAPQCASGQMIVPVFEYSQHQGTNA